MKTKARTNILIDEQILRRAQDMGLNISRTCERALSMYAECIHNGDCQIKNGFLGAASFGKEGAVNSVVRSPRFEPGSSAWQADVLDQTRLRPHIRRV